MNNTDKDKCSGLLDFCTELSSYMTGTSNSKGIGKYEFMNFRERKHTRAVAFLRYGTKKDDSICLNFCPFCGADYEKMGRLG
jgi:hypothetical protein